MGLRDRRVGGADGAEHDALSDPTAAVTEPEPPQSAATRRSLSGILRRGAVASAVALAAVQVVTLVQTLVLARLLTPTEVGLFAAGTALVTFLGPIAEGALSQALIQTRADIDDAADTAFWATVGSHVLLCLALMACSPVVGWVFGSVEVGVITAATAGGLVLFSLTTVPDALMQRRLQFVRRVIVDPAQTFVFAVVSIVLAARGFGVWSLVIGSYAAMATWVVGSWWFAGYRPGRGRPSVAMWREMARYGFPLLLSSLAERTRDVIELVIVGRWLSESALGQLRYGRRIAVLPAGLIVSAGGFVLFPGFARIADDTDRLRAAFLRALRWRCVAAALAAGVLVALGAPMTVVLFGEPWREAGTVVVAMAGAAFGQAVLAVAVEVLKAGGDSRPLNLVTAVGAVAGIGLLVALLPLGLLGVGLAATGAMALAAATALNQVRDRLAVTFPSMLREVLPPLVSAAVAAAAVWPLERLVVQADTHPVASAVGLLAGESVAFAVLYLAVLWMLAPTTATTIVRSVGRVAGRLRR
jgi:PST family polysaccharide transporter